jgi:hypothetical protein
MPLFVPGWSPRRPDHNARRDKPQPLMARNKGPKEPSGHARRIHGFQTAH